MAANFHNNLQTGRETKPAKYVVSSFKGSIQPSLNSMENILLPYSGWRLCKIFKLICCQSNSHPPVKNNYNHVTKHGTAPEAFPPSFFPSQWEKSLPETREVIQQPWVTKPWALSTSCPGGFPSSRWNAVKLWQLQPGNSDWTWSQRELK